MEKNGTCNECRFFNATNYVQLTGDTSASVTYALSLKNTSMPGAGVCELDGETVHETGSCGEFEKQVESKPDMVNHPPHYCRDGGMESIDEMVLIFGKEAVMSFCLCNAWKYRYRAADKNGAEDIAKSDWYIRKYKELKEEKPQDKHPL